MKRPLIACVVVLVALPAHGDNALLTPPVLGALTSIDALPSVPALNTAFTSPEIAQANLGIIALDPSIEPGIRIRALRTLASYCTEQGCPDGTVHQALSMVIASYQKIPAGHAAPADLMLMRAAVETMGAAHAVLPADIDALVALLAHPSRDVRATVVRTLRSSCSAQALSAILTRHPSEPTAQVRTEMVAAEQVLGGCSPK